MTTAPKTKRFKVMAISSNRQAFGHSGHILIAEDGTAVEGDRQRNNINKTIPDLKMGDILEFQVDATGLPTNWADHRFEFMVFARQGKAPKPVVDQVWHPDFPKNAMKE